MNLRNALAACLDEILGDEYHEAEHRTLNAILAVLADPTHRLELLNLAGEPINGWVLNVSLEKRRGSFPVDLDDPGKYAEDYTPVVVLVPR